MAKRKTVRKTGKVQASTAPRRRYPSLPKLVNAAGGAVEVALVPLPGNDDGNMGHFDPSIRRIEIQDSLRGDQRWLVLYHELAHVALWDSGVHNQLLGTEEAVCDAIATARLRERFD